MGHQRVDNAGEIGSRQFERRLGQRWLRAQWRHAKRNEEDKEQNASGTHWAHLEISLEEHCNYGNS
jgi:hypothetical protein